MFLCVWLCECLCVSAFMYEPASQWAFKTCQVQSMMGSHDRFKKHHDLLFWNMTILTHYDTSISTKPHTIILPCFHNHAWSSLSHTSPTWFPPQIASCLWQMQIQTCQQAFCPWRWHGPTGAPPTCTPRKLCSHHWWLCGETHIALLQPGGFLVVFIKSSQKHLNIILIYLVQ